MIHGFTGAIMHSICVNQDSPDVYIHEHDILAHVTMEAEMSHNLLSMSWRLGKLGDVIQSKSKGLRSRVAD